MVTTLLTEAPILSPRQRDGLLVRVVEGETVVLDRARGVIHRLNGTASAIWSQCDGTQAPHVIARRLSEVFDVDPMTAERDVASALKNLADLGLLQAE